MRESNHIEQQHSDSPEIRAEKGTEHDLESEVATAERCLEFEKELFRGSSGLEKHTEQLRSLAQSMDVGEASYIYDAVDAYKFAIYKYRDFLRQELGISEEAWKKAMRLEGKNSSENSK